jgi:hypothetical protein
MSPQSQRILFPLSLLPLRFRLRFRERTPSRSLCEFGKRPAQPATFELRKPFDALVSAANNENGWADWSGLATLMGEISQGIASRLQRLLSLDLSIAEMSSPRPPSSEGPLASLPVA